LSRNHENNSKIKACGGVEKYRNDRERIGEASKIDYPTVYRISTGDTLNPSKKTLEPIAAALKINLDWLHKGIGERDAQPVEETGVNPYKDFAIKHLTEEIAYYRQLLMQITGGKGFLQLINNKPHPAALRTA
jgi:transcriptional regulator with XRE-family HTH domain